MGDFHSLQRVEDAQKNRETIIKKTEDRLKREEEALKKMMEKVEHTKKSIEYQKQYLERTKKDYEASNERRTERKEEKNGTLKWFKQLSYEYHSVAKKLSLDEEVEAKGKLTSEPCVINNFRERKTIPVLQNLR